MISDITTNIIDVTRNFLETYYQTHFPADQYTYHTWDRILLIENAVLTICEHEQCNDEEIELLRLAALFHDVGIHVDRDNHERASVAAATQFLSENQYDKAKIEQVSTLILATQEGLIPKTKLEAIIKDMSLSSFADDNYFEMLDGLRQEWAYFDIHHPESDDAFYTLVINWCSNNSYYTDTAALLYPKYKSNLKTLKQIRKKIRVRGEGAEKPSLNQTRAGQMMIKTALRNHIDLTELADKKASTMLSINSLIITIAIPLMLPSIDANRYLALPVILLLVFCISSILFATLVTKPVKMSGLTYASELEKGYGDLFFFGNFFNMPFETYEKAMEQTIFNDAKLDRMIVRDLYLSGKVLGSKYSQLRFCYLIFLAGIIAATLSLILVLSLTYI